MKIAYVCTNYNSSELTIKAAKSLLSIPGSENVKIVIVDNSSDRQSRELLNQFIDDHPSVDVIFSEENLGYFRGLNLGISFVREKYGEFSVMVIGNNDLEFPNDFFVTLASNQLLFQKYPVVSPNLITLDGIRQNPHIREGVSKRRELIWALYYTSYPIAKLLSFISSKTRRFTERKDYTSWEKAGEIYQGYGACYLLGPIFFKYFEKLWAPTFLYGEEYFLWKQLNSVNLKLYYEPSIEVWHMDHATTGRLQKRVQWEYSKIAYELYKKHGRY